MRKIREVLRLKFNLGALFAGAGVAIEGTVELGYKVLASAPSRFIGRTLLAGLKKLDDKMKNAGSKPK